MICKQIIRNTRVLQVMMKDALNLEIDKKWTPYEK
jgi:hypothetical protein